MSFADDIARARRLEREKIQKVNSLIRKWREKPTCLQSVVPRKVIPDTTNRENTGLSVDHCHFIASKMESKGFVKRVGRHGHDLPILVRESAASRMGALSMVKWRQSVAKHKLFPRIRMRAGENLKTGRFLDAVEPDLNDTEEFFCSLGNGHFFQALNLIDTEHDCMYKQNGTSRNEDSSQRSRTPAHHNMTPSLSFMSLPSHMSSSGHACIVPPFYTAPVMSTYGERLFMCYPVAMPVS